MSPDTKFALKYPFEIMNMGGESVAVAIENGADSFHGIIKLKNESAEFLFSHLQNGITLDELTNLCLAEFPSSEKADVTEMIVSFVDSLRDAGIILEETAL